MNKTMETTPYQKKRMFFIKLGKTINLYINEDDFYYAGVKKFTRFFSKKIFFLNFFKSQILSTEELILKLLTSGLSKKDCDEFIDILEANDWELQLPLRSGYGTIKIFKIFEIFNNKDVRYHKLTLTTHFRD